ncbi:hypothetical protein FOZ62_013682 [Perkinsus olseni]|uniref:Reverse transcriptase domain-containing protein n=1 Tax=Perkinsus olseni TaxID=32597 RepID=A0A7J6RDI0_PEROL|nr:hypothetical protein FOZ62_013682 [Perkinsus olseni]
MVASTQGSPKQRQANTRSTGARARRNAKRAQRRSASKTVQSDLQASLRSTTSYASSTDPSKVLDYYATTASLFRFKQRDRCVEELSDGSAKPAACRWFEDNAPNPTPIHRLLQSQLEQTVTKVLHSRGLIDRLVAWSQLDRSAQPSEVDLLRDLEEVITEHSEHLAATWASLLRVSSDKAPECSIRATLTKALLLATKRPDDLEDTLICDEILRGCGIGIDSPIPSTGLWPSDKGPKHSGFGLCLSAATSWKNYASTELYRDQVQETLDREVAKGHMCRLLGCPDFGVVTKLACIVKPSGALRLIDDLRRSGVNERVLSEETVALPGLATAALLLQEMKQRVPQAELVWIEADIASAFRHLPVCVDDRKYLINCVNGCYYQHLRLPFGLRCSPLFWCRYFAAVHRLVKRLAPADPSTGAGMIYVDDVAWITTRESSVSMMVRILLVQATLGLSIAYEKLRITTRPHSLGYEWDVSESTVYLPVEKRTKLMDELKVMLTSGSSKIPVALLERVTGRLTWATQIAPMYSSDLNPFYGLQAVARKHNLFKVSLGPKVLTSASLFYDLLKIPDMAATTASQLLGWGVPDESGTVVVSDASLFGIGGVIFDLEGGPSADLTPQTLTWFSVAYHDVPSIQDLVPWTTATRESEIGPLELLACIIGVVHALRRGARMITVLSDNAATVACMNRKRARSQRMNDTMRKLRKVWPQLGYTVVAEHIKGITNGLADVLSRSTSGTADDLMCGLGQRFDPSSLIRELVNLTL